VPLAVGHVRLAAPLGVVVPAFRQEQPPVQRAGGLVGHGVHAHADLAVGHLAQRPAVLRGDPHRVAAELREAGVIEHPGIGGQGGGHALGEPAAHGGGVPGGLVDELLQRLLERVGVRLGVTAGQPGGHRLDRLALAVQQQPAQVGLAPAALVLAGDGREQVLGERGQAGAETAKLCGGHSWPPAAVAHSFRLGGSRLRDTPNSRTLARPNRVLLAGTSRAGGAAERSGSASSAALPVRARSHGGRGGWAPTRDPTPDATPDPTHATCVPPCCLDGGIAAGRGPSGERSGRAARMRFARFFDSARPRSWRAFGPRRLRRQSEPALMATQSDAA
jgi:hypothetical protein